MHNFIEMMESVKIIFLIIYLLNLIFLMAFGNQQNTLTDLRRFKVEGVAGRFTVDRSALERELQKRKQQDVACGQDMHLQLPQSLPHIPYNVSYEGEAVLFHSIVTDETLAAELTNDLKDQIATSYRLFVVGIPVVLGVTEKHGVLLVKGFTNSTKKVLNPYFTNNKDVTQVDSIVEEGGGIVKVRHGDDVMVYQVQDEIKYKGQNSVGKDFDKALGEVTTATNYPLPFDWSCEVLGAQMSFCRALNKVRCKLAAVGGDVCTLTSATSSEQSPTTIKIVKMTGIFRDSFPFLAGTVPNESFEAALGGAEYTTGITFPCSTH